ncbi:MAG: hypothetical protein QM831_01955 [Kofleriaceae bacterium]
MIRSLALVAVMTASASADDWLFTSREANPAPTRYAIAVNDPIGWKAFPSFGLSAYVGVTDFLAIRANFATYSVVSTAEAILETECSRSGRIWDTSIGAQYYVTSHLYDGPFVELDVLRRDQPATRDPCANPLDEDVVKTSDTTFYGGEAFVGWTITPAFTHHHFFMSVALGFSDGYESGSSSTTTYPIDMPSQMITTTHATIGHQIASAEWAFRMGGSF